MFDHNAMSELAAIKRARGGGRRKDGPNRTVTTKAFHDARTADLSQWQRLLYETQHRWKAACELEAEQYRLAVLTSKGGFYDEKGEIPF